MFVAIETSNQPSEWFSFKDEKSFSILLKFLKEKAVLICRAEKEKLFAEVKNSSLPERSKAILTEFIRQIAAAKNQKSFIPDISMLSHPQSEVKDFESSWENIVQSVDSRSTYSIGAKSKDVFDETLGRLASISSSVIIYDRFAYVLFSADEKIVEDYRKKGVDLSRPNIVDWFLEFKHLDIHIYTSCPRLMNTDGYTNGASKKDASKSSFLKLAPSMNLGLREKAKLNSPNRSGQLSLSIFQYTQETQHDRWVIFNISGREFAVQLSGGLSDYIFEDLPAPKVLSLMSEASLISDVHDSWIHHDLPVRSKNAFTRPSNPIIFN